jgi:hypothetical protein
MSPDWSAQAEPVPYAQLNDPQSLNLYAYVQNNPMTGRDPDGHYLAPADPSSNGTPQGPDPTCNMNQPSLCIGLGVNGQQGPVQQQVGQDPTLPTAVAPPSSWVDSLMNAIFPKTWGDMASLALAVPTDGLAEGAAPLARGLELSMKFTEEGASDAEKVAKITEEADKFYPSKAGKIEAHHVMPQALGEPKSGPTTDLPASYHQLITNMTRTLRSFPDRGKAGNPPT